MIARELLFLAAGLAFRRPREQLWRLAAVGLTSTIVMLLLLSGASILHMRGQEEVRRAQQFAYLAPEPASTDLLLVAGADFWAGKPIDVVWLEPAAIGHDTVLPVGLRALPERGSAAVSPARARLIEQNPELSKRYPNHSELDSSSVGAGDSLLAFVRPAEQRFDPSTPQKHVSEGGITGDGSVMRVSAFGPQVGPLSIYIGSLDEPLPKPLLIAGLIGLLGIPLVVVLIVGLATGSSTRASRFRLLHALGAPRAAIRMVATAECMLLSVPGSAIVIVSWAILSPGFTAIPILGRSVVPGDLAWSIWAYPLLLLAGVALAGLVGFLSAGFERNQLGPRPVVGQSRLRWWLGLPLGLSCVAFSAMLFVNNRLDADLAFIGSGLALVGVAALTPSVLRLCGTVLGRMEATSPFLSGRLLTWRPEWIASTYAGVAVMLVLILGSTGYATSIDYSQSIAAGGPPTSGPSVTEVETLSAPAPAELIEFRERVSGNLLVPLVGHSHGGEQPDTHSHDEPAEHDHPEEAGPGPVEQAEAQPVVLGVSCPELREVMHALTCSLSAYKLSDADVRVARRWAEFHISYASPESDFRLADPKTMHAHHLAVIGTAEPADLDRTVRSAAIQTFGVTMVNTRSVIGADSLLGPWLSAALLVANLALACACLVALTDRIIRSRQEHRILINLGTSPRQFGALFGWLFAVPFAAVAAIGFGVGTVVCAVMIYRAEMPWEEVMNVGLVTIGVWVLGTVANALVGARAVAQPRE